MTDMVRFSVLLLLATAGAVTAQAADVNTCTTCHIELEDEELNAPVRLMADDVHVRRGLSCHDCHGGDASSDDEDGSMDEDAGFVGFPDKTDQPAFCGKCHSDATYMRQYNPALRVDQVALYWTSRHGERLSSEDDSNVAACVDCHGAHGILEPDDPRSRVYAANVPAMCGACHSDAVMMKPYGIPTDQHEKYEGSVHGEALLARGDLAAPACNDCHGNHGAAPPGAEYVGNVCGQCHPTNNELVSRSPHQPAFAALDLAVCETCHNHHDVQAVDDSMVGTDPPALCARCHSADKRRAGWEAAAEMRASLDSLLARHSHADSVVRRAERAGMAVTDALYDLNEARGRVTMYRSVLHSLDMDELATVRAQGTDLTTRALREGEEALEDLAFRRTGLGASLVVILILGTALFFKIRSLERNNP